MAPPRKRRLRKLFNSMYDTTSMDQSQIEIAETNFMNYFLEKDNLPWQNAEITEGDYFAGNAIRHYYISKKLYSPRKAGSSEGILYNWGGINPIIYPFEYQHEGEYEFIIEAHTNDFITPTRNIYLHVKDETEDDTYDQIIITTSSHTKATFSFKVNGTTFINGDLINIKLAQGTSIDFVADSTDPTGIKWDGSSGVESTIATSIAGAINNHDFLSAVVDVDLVTIIVTNELDRGATGNYSKVTFSVDTLNQLVSSSETFENGITDDKFSGISTIVVDTDNPSYTNLELPLKVSYLVTQRRIEEYSLTDPGFKIYWKVDAINPVSPF